MCLTSVTRLDLCREYIKDNRLKNPIDLEEKWQTICNVKFHLKHYKVHKRSMNVKITL